MSPTNDQQSPPTNRPILKLRSKGDTVRELQTLLNKNGAGMAVDGDFGSHTQAVVYFYQATRGLPVDGEVGPTTWNALLTDAPSVVGPPPPPTQSPQPPGDFVQRLLNEARQHVNVSDEGPGRNENKFSKFFNRPAEPWCADFVSYCATKAGKPLNQASVDKLLKQFKTEGKFHIGNPMPGDIIIFDAVRGDADPSNHTGIVESVTEAHVETIEGNSGDGVRRRAYLRGDDYIVGYGTL